MGFAIATTIFVTGVCNNLKTMNYVYVRIGKQRNIYSNYSCLHPSKRCKQEFELLLPCLPILADP